MASPSPAAGQPFVSVVTPVYNGAPFLAECIESVLAQTYPHWEYVIVNNCSTDRSLEIAQAYAQRDPRVRIHNNTEFLPALRNLNHAFRQISTASKYCKAVHADDWLFPDCLAQMVAVAEAHPSTGIIGAYRLDDVRVNLDGLPYPSPITPGREVGRRYFLAGQELFGSPTSLLIRSEILRGRPDFYDESNYHADTAVCLDLLREWDFGFVHQVLTFTRRQNESRSSAVHRFHTHRLARLAIALKFGPAYLTAAEQRDHIARLLESQYRFLAHSVFQMRDAEFWAYQRQALETLGQPLSRWRLLRAIALELLDVRQAIRDVRAGLARRRGQPAPEASP